MSINYASIKAAMIAAGYKATEGEGWAASDAAEFRTFSHFVLGIDHSQAHLVTTLPQVFQDKLEAAGIDALGEGLPMIEVEPSYDSEADEFSRSIYQEVEAQEGQRAPEPEAFAFTVTGAKAEQEVAAQPAVDASEPAATAPNVVGEGESTGEAAKPAQIADSATTLQDDETADDLEQAHHDEGDEADEDDTPPADDGDDAAADEDEV